MASEKSYVTNEIQFRSHNYMKSQSTEKIQSITVTTHYLFEHLQHPFQTQTRGLKFYRKTHIPSKMHKLKRLTQNPEPNHNLRTAMCILMSINKLILCHPIKFKHNIKFQPKNKKKLKFQLNSQALGHPIKSTSTITTIAQSDKVESATRNK